MWPCSPELNRGNLYVEQTCPFSLAKDPAQAARLDEVLYNLVEVCRVLAVLLWPFMPGIAEKIFAQLNLPGAPDRMDLATWGGFPPGLSVPERKPSDSAGLKTVIGWVFLEASSSSPASASSSFFWPPGIHWRFEVGGLLDKRFLSQVQAPGTSVFKPAGLHGFHAGTDTGHRIGAPIPLFPRKDLKPA